MAGWLGGDAQDRQTDTTDQMLASYEKYLPGLSELMQRQYAPDAAAKLSAAQAVSPGYQEIVKNEQLSGVKNDTNMLNTAGGDYSKALMGLQRSFDPEYFKGREDISNNFDALLKTYNISGGLSDAEKESVSRETNKKNVASGNLNRDSATRTISNAMNFGDRFSKKQTQFGDALTKYGSLLPALKTGFDASALGSKPIGTGFGAYKSVADGSAANSNNFLGVLGQIGTTTANAETPLAQANKNIASMLCWVAREVYGADDPKWLQFRTWVINKAPKRFYNFYKTYGPAIAEYIKDKPFLKLEIRNWMDTKLA